CVLGLNVRWRARRDHEELTGGRTSLGPVGQDVRAAACRLRAATRPGTRRAIMSSDAPRAVRTRGPPGADAGRGMEPAPPPALGALLRQYRRAAGLSQEALAEQAGLSARAISDLERGVNRTARKDTLQLLAAALALSPAERATLEAAAQ